MHGKYVQHASAGGCDDATGMENVLITANGLWVMRVRIYAT